MYLPTKNTKLIVINASNRMRALMALYSLPGGNFSAVIQNPDKILKKIQLKKIGKTMNDDPR
jgi:hypothetical protein